MAFCYGEDYAQAAHLPVCGSRRLNYGVQEFTFDAVQNREVLDVEDQLLAFSEECSPYIPKDVDEVNLSRD